ncbi:hypothetical protein [Pseudogracilibacillus sp. ICA-222130]
MGKKNKKNKKKISFLDKVEWTVEIVEILSLPIRFIRSIIRGFTHL